MLPRLVGGLLLVGVLAIPLVTHPWLYGACPQTQEFKVLCPEGAPSCDFCTQQECGGNTCPIGAKRYTDNFQCQPNPDQQTKCVNPDNQTAICYELYPCIWSKELQKCVPDTNHPRLRVVDKPIFTTKPC
jgi:hypothetical protein